MSKQTIVVFGATGKQGGSVVKSLLQDPKSASKFHVKAVTRDVSKDSAKSLEALGAEVVSADLDKPETLSSVIKGAYGVFSVTNFLEKLNAAPEIVQGKAVADICKAEGVQHLVWSSLLNVTELTGGKLKNVHHFDSKAEVEAYIRDIGVPATFFLAGYFMSNLPGMSIREMPDGNWGLGLPTPANAPMPLFAAELDTGKFVKGIFLNKDKVLGERIYGATAYYTPTQIIEEFKESYPKVAATTSYNELPAEVYKSILGSIGLPPSFQEEMSENHQLFSVAGYFGGANLDASHAIVGEPLTTWKQYIANNPAFAAIKS
ncbi:NmrA-domain-containing protein [Dothidotthia symphoricarpi CBS 119687]|uniref:NmrA-like family domain-containing protein 1 n=1 Tax=Dothidotthia symphoricarpi CBS 119687 TaxID=1392245 RepID=A0A6A6AN24_9PLEO|nr:NmrA-domain-containing protein [Dothidotthia symphoricarpi CBS 119687]KAF2132455.1 NmrA-domain-containing protein [Dothidotthia symphoricarpi CBS 119687]